MNNHPKNQFPTQHIELGLADIALYPDLHQVYRVWQRAGGPGIPDRIDPLDLPRPVFPYVMLLDIDPGRGELAIRLAGDFVRDKLGGAVSGKTPFDYFDEVDAHAVVAHARRVALTGAPSLAHREYITIDNALWAYTRLMLPLAHDGTAARQIFKVVEPRSLTEMSGVPRSQQSFAGHCEGADGQPDAQPSPR